MTNTITINNDTPNVATITNRTPSGALITTVNVPPSAALNFGVLGVLFRSMVPQATEPASPTENDVYLDDGTNTASGTLGFRRYDGSAWEDFGLQSAAGAISLSDLSDVSISTIVDGERLVYSASSGKWENSDTLDGGSF